MRVVVDTNVLISAAFRDRLPEDVIMFLVTHPDFEWITTEKILQEYPDVLHRKKFSLAESLIQKWEQMVEEGIHVVPDSIVVAFPRDQKDAKFHSCALSAEGYITEFSAPGPDGGVDILAGGGTLGFQEPRLCVQVKSSQSPAHVTILRSLQCTMQNFKANQGLLVSWGGFNKAVEKKARPSFFSVRLWDANDLIEAIFKNYDSLPEGLQSELPLKRIWALVIKE